MDPLALLRLDTATTFELDATGRIQRENLPDGSRAPRAFIAGCPAGNLVHVRADVAADVAAQVTALVAAEPPWIDPNSRPGCLDQIAGLLRPPPARIGAGFNHLLPRQAPPSGAFTCSDTAEGGVLLAALREEGMPPHLVAAGFVSVADLWPPWCVVIEHGAIAAIAFAARLAPASAAVGVYTFPDFRGRGLAAAVTARWTTLPDLADRTLFYGTSDTNTSSQKVAARLSLPRIGLGLRIA